MLQSEIDTNNARFWDELCGTALAISLGVTDNSPQSLARLDKHYFDLYPYLANYVQADDLAGAKVLEIGLGYGSLSQLLASKGADYHGLDIAAGPVAIVRHRLNLLGVENPEQKVLQGTALKIPFPDNYFDFVYAIGALHHTGNLTQSIAEAYRVLRPGGKSLIMIYNRSSYRQIIELPLDYWKRRLTGSKENYDEFMRATYDSNSVGEANPHTDFTSPAQAKVYFKYYSRVKTDIQNFDSYSFFSGKLYLDRKLFLNNIGRILGLDLYITAFK